MEQQRKDIFTVLEEKEKLISRTDNRPPQNVAYAITKLDKTRSDEGSDDFMKTPSEFNHKVMDQVIKEEKDKRASQMNNDVDVSKFKSNNNPFEDNVKGQSRMEEDLLGLMNADDHSISLSFHNENSKANKSIVKPSESPVATSPKKSAILLEAELLKTNLLAQLDNDDSDIHNKSDSGVGLYKSSHGEPEVQPMQILQADEESPKKEEKSGENTTTLANEKPIADSEEAIDSISVAAKKIVEAVHRDEEEDKKEEKEAAEQAADTKKDDE